MAGRANRCSRSEKAQRADGSLGSSRQTVSCIRSVKLRAAAPVVDGDGGGISVAPAAAAAAAADWCAAAGWNGAFASIGGRFAISVVDRDRCPGGIDVRGALHPAPKHVLAVLELALPA